VGKTNVLAVEVQDEPGGLAQVLAKVSEVDINVEYMYGFLSRWKDSAVLVFRFDHMDLAMEVLQRNGFNILTSEQVCGI